MAPGMVLQLPEGRSRMNFAQRLQELRLARNLSEEEMAGALACTVKELARLEGNEREPMMGELLAAARTFGVSTDYLLGVPGAGAGVSPAGTTAGVSGAGKGAVAGPGGGGFNPLSALAGMALPGGFRLEDAGGECDMDEELARELAEMVSAIDVRRNRKKDGGEA